MADTASTTASTTPAIAPLLPDIGHMSPDRESGGALDNRLYAIRKPMAPVHLTLTLPGGQTLRLGQFTPHGRDMGFNARVHLPAEAKTGTATIHDDPSHPEAYHFKVHASR